MLLVYGFCKYGTVCLGLIIEEVPMAAETRTTSVPSNLVDGGKLTFSTIFAGIFVCMSLILYRSIFLQL